MPGRSYWLGNQYSLFKEKTCTVIPAKAGIQEVRRTISPLDSRLRGNDDHEFFLKTERFSILNRIGFRIFLAQKKLETGSRRLETKKACAI
jgi:hypothetical protein